MQRDAAVLLDIAHAARLVSGFLVGVTEEAFLEDPKTQSAVQHQLLVIGEAVKRLSPEFRAANGQVPWNLIAGMRDHLIHAYDAVDLEEVWRTCTVDVPALLLALKGLLPQDSTQEEPSAGAGSERSEGDATQ